MAPLSTDSLEFIINHVILPPKLPQEADDPKVSRAAEQQLLRLLSSKLATYSLLYQQGNHSSAATFGQACRIVQTMLLRCARVVSAENLSTELLTRLFDELIVEGESLLPAELLLTLPSSLLM